MLGLGELVRSGEGADSPLVPLHVPYSSPSSIFILLHFCCRISLSGVHIGYGVYEVHRVHGVLGVHGSLELMGVCGVHGIHRAHGVPAVDGIFRAHWLYGFHFAYGYAEGLHAALLACLPSKSRRVPQPWQQHDIVPPLALVWHQPSASALQVACLKT